jgi:hypothetical protein
MILVLSLTLSVRCLLASGSMVFNCGKGYCSFIELLLVAFEIVLSFFSFFLILLN